MLFPNFTLQPIAWWAGRSATAENEIHLVLAIIYSEGRIQMGA